MAGPICRRIYAPPPPDPAVKRDLPCVGCGYNLRTLRADCGRCPECGVAVSASVGLRREAPWWDATRWPAAVRDTQVWRWASYVVAAATSAGVAALVVVALVEQTRPPPPPGSGAGTATAGRPPAGFPPAGTARGRPVGSPAQFPSSLPPPPLAGRAPGSGATGPDEPLLKALRPEAATRIDEPAGSSNQSGRNLADAIRESAERERKVLEELRGNERIRPGP